LTKKDVVHNLKKLRDKSLFINFEFYKELIKYLEIEYTLERK